MINHRFIVPDFLKPYFLKSTLVAKMNWNDKVRCSSKVIKALLLYAAQ
jgi:hypothetical protein